MKMTHANFSHQNIRRSNYIFVGNFWLMSGNSFQTELKRMFQIKFFLHVNSVKWGKAQCQEKMV